MSERVGFSRTTSGIATFGGRPVTELLTEAGVGTPAYIYDISAISARVKALVGAFGGARHLVAYAVKANSAGTIVRAIKEAGAGIDAVSGGELLLGLAAGVAPTKIVLSGVAKRDDEIDLAVHKGILAIQSESVTELQRIAARASAAGARARVSMRINPSIEIDSHAHISTGHDKAKFGIAARDLSAALEVIESNPHALELVGLSTHVGSMLKSTEPYVGAARVVCETARAVEARAHRLEYLDFGGGFGIDYGDGAAPPITAFAEAALGLLRAEGFGDRMLVVEPGRSLVADLGMLASRVVQSKTSGQRRWLMVDAGMNDLLRPALYQARHRIEALSHPPSGTSYRVVGPVCESTDDFGDHDIGAEPEFVAFRDAGAYGFSMASEYNARPLPAEIFVEDGKVHHVHASPGVDAWVASRLGA